MRPAAPGLVTPTMASDPPTSRPSSPRKSTAFRFKASATSPAASKPHPSAHSHGRHHHHHHHHRHHRHRRHRSPPPRSPPLSPATAFRESLFDALADDEGAAYWEAVYGQPIHTYAPPAFSRRASGAAGSGAGNVVLEDLDPEEYASYVRARMWERSHEHVARERASRTRRRREEGEARKRRGRERTGDGAGDGGGGSAAWEAMLDAGLARGRARRAEREWREAWSRYLRGWAEEDMKNKKKKKEEEVEGRSLRLPWPTLSGGPPEDVGAASVAEFFRRAPVAGVEADEEEEGRLLRAVLKAERVRWHPDKVMQRFGGAVDAGTLALVTAVFQVVDGMWGKAKGGL